MDPLIRRGDDQTPVKHPAVVSVMLDTDCKRAARTIGRWFDDAQDKARAWVPAPCPPRKN